MHKLLKRLKKLSITKQVAAFMSLVMLALIVCANPSDSHILARVVRIQSDKGMCSGEQVRAPSGKDYILTASHCKGLIHDGSMSIITEDGKKLERKVIAEDPNSDLLLLEGLPNLKGLDIADSTRRRQESRSFTHGHALDAYSTKGEIVQIDYQIQVPLSVVDTKEQEAACTAMPKNKVMDLPVLWFKVKVCALDVKETVTTTPTVPGSSGGPIVDSRGRLIGVVSAGDGSFGYLIRLSDIHNFVDNY